jgi:hypothetical protein
MILENCSYLRDARVGKEAKALKKKGHKVSVISPEHGQLPVMCAHRGLYAQPKVQPLRRSYPSISETTIRP